MNGAERIYIREYHKHRYISQAEIAHELEQMERMEREEQTEKEKDH